MPIRLIYRQRRAANLILSGGDNTPHGMTNDETIVQKIEIDPMTGESINEFVTRATKLVIKHFPTGKLHRLPHHVIAFVDYSLNNTNDYGNGVIAGGTSLAMSYDKKILVLCFCAHKDDRGDSQKAYTNVRTHSFNSDPQTVHLGNGDYHNHVSRGGNHTSHGHTVHIGASEFQTRPNAHTGHAGHSLAALDDTEETNTHTGLFGHLDFHVPHIIGLHHTAGHVDDHHSVHGNGEHHTSAVHSNAEHDTLTGLLSHLDFHVPRIGGHSTAGHSDGQHSIHVNGDHHARAGHYAEHAETHNHTGILGHLDIHIPHIGLHTTTGHSDGHHTARSETGTHHGQHTARSEPGEHHSVLSDIAHTLHIS